MKKPLVREVMEEMFAQHVGTESAIMLKTVRRLLSTAAAFPTEFHGLQGSYLDRFHAVCPLWTMSTFASTGDVQAQPTMTPVHYLVLRK